MRVRQCNAFYICSDTAVSFAERVFGAILFCLLNSGFYPCLISCPKEILILVLNTEMWQCVVFNVLFLIILRLCFADICNLINEYIII